MIFLKNISLPSYEVENNFLFSSYERKMTCFNSYYPFGVFNYRLRNNLRLEFEPITIFCGGNGSGKSTILNIIAEKLKINRTTLFNKSFIFDEYLNLVHYEISLN